MAGQCFSIVTFIVGLNAFVSVCRVLTGQWKLRADRERKNSYAINSVICRRDGPNTAVRALYLFTLVPFLTPYSRKKRGLYQGLANVYESLALSTYTS